MTNDISGEPSGHRERHILGEDGNPLANVPTVEEERSAALAAQEEERVRANDEIAKRQVALTESNVNLTRKLTYFTGVGVFAAFLAAGIYYFQLMEMRETNRLTREALKGSSDTLQKTLDKMQAQVEATDGQTLELKKQVKSSAVAAEAAAAQAAGMSSLVLVTNRQFDSSQRPWLQENVVLYSPRPDRPAVGMDDNGNLEVFVIVQMMNSGASPAIHARVEAELIGSPRLVPRPAERKALEERQAALCAKTDSETSRIVNGTGDTIFPKNTAQQPAYLRFDKDQIAAELAHPSNYIYSGKFPGTDQQVVWIDGDHGHLGALSSPGVAVMGCITYLAGYSGEERQTAFLYDLAGLDLRHLTAAQVSVVRIPGIGNRAE